MHTYDADVTINGYPTIEIDLNDYLPPNATVLGGDDDEQDIECSFSENISIRIEAENPTAAKDALTATSQLTWHNVSHSQECACRKPVSEVEPPFYEAGWIIWWGGWGGVACGWASPSCILHSHIDDLIEEGIEPTEEALDAHHEKYVGEGFWPRQEDLIVDHADELTLRCDTCNTLVADLIADYSKRKEEAS